MRQIEYTAKFKRDLKLAKKRNKKLTLLQGVMQLIVDEIPIPEKYHDHSLVGNWSHHRELHVEPDWLLIYKIDHPRQTVIFVRTGSHADLF